MQQSWFLWLAALSIGGTAHTVSAPAVIQTAHMLKIILCNKYHYSFFNCISKTNLHFELVSPVLSVPLRSYQGFWKASPGTVHFYINTKASFLS